MTEKPAYTELEKRVKELEIESSARKRAEEALATERDLFRQVAENIEDVFWIVSPDWNKVFYISPAYEKIWGRSCESLFENPLSWLDAVLDADRQCVADYIDEKRMGALEEIFFPEYRIIRPNGEIRWIAAKGFPVLDEQGDVYHIVGIAEDITQRKQVEKALRESEERYRNILENIEEGYYEVDLAGNFTFINDSVCELLGYTRDELMGMNNRQYTDPETAKELFNVFNEVYKTGVPTKGFDWELIRKDGTRRFGEASVSLLRDAKDTPIGFRGIARDVTERKQAEKALKQETEFHRVMGAIANEFITASSAVIDESIDRALQAIGNFVGADRSYVIRFDFQAGTICNTHEWCREGIEPQIENLQDLPIEKFRWLIDQLADLQVVNIPKVADLPKEARAEKEEFETEGIRSLLLVPLMSEGRCVGTVGFDFVTQARFCSEREIRLLQMSGATLSNALDRKRAEEALRESEKKYKDLYEEAPVGYMEYDDKGRITRVNRRELEMLGYTAEEMVGKPAWDFVLEKDKGQALIKAKLAGEKPPSKNLERMYIRKDGTMFPGLIEDVIFKDKIGRIIGIRSTIQDITERKRTEDRLRESEEKLARSKKMESLGLLAGGVAHDLNNVLAGIVSYPELLLLDLSEDSKFRKPIQTIQESGNRAVAIVQDLLTIARGVASPKETLNLNDIIREYLISPEFKKLEQLHPTITVKTDLEPDLFNISGSLVHIRKVIMNLVSNSSEAIESTGNVIISTMNRYVDRPIRGYDDVKIGEYVVLAVSDDGSGILSDYLERIFEPFFTKKIMGRSGTGLGLAVVWNIVQDHEGYIDVASGEKGTSFELYFPITRDDVIVKDLPISMKDYKGRGETILVVDDIESQREISCIMLDALGYKTIAIPSGEEAVKYLKEHTVDLILLDMIMDPGINGRDTYERIIKIHPKQKAI